MSDAPFKRGDLVRSLYDNIMIREGKHYRVVRVRAHDDCGSGWMVSVTRAQPGPMPKKDPPICGEVDSDWFDLVR